MGAAGCGCAILDRSEREPDPQVAATQRERGERMRRVWCCPCGTREPPPESAEALPEAAREALDAVEHVTGARGLTTCPLFYARLPWVAEAVRARRWAERGDLRTRYPDPPAVLLDAIDAVDAGIGARQAADEHERELKRKAKNHGR